MGDDWDETPSTGFGGGSGGFSSGTVQSDTDFKKLRGFGRGKPLSTSGGTANGFGPTAGAGDSDWASGFGSSSGFGGGSSRGGGRGGGSRGCFKCGEDGHISRECPKGGGGGGGGGRGCFKCGEEGHMSRECPSAGSGGGGRGRGCFKCGEEGHMSRDCPTGGSGGGGRSGGCFKCGEEGHMSRDCTQGGGGGNRACRKCNQEGHLARDCPENSSGGGGGFVDWGAATSGDANGFGGGFGGGEKKKGCFKCGEGHMSRDCPQGGGGGGGGGKGCFKCGEEGHISRDCPQGGGGGGGGGGKGCFKCGEEGHISRECPQAGAAGDRPAPQTYVPPPPPEGEEEIFRHISKGINFDKYDDIPVEVTGRDAPKQGVTSFRAVQLHENCMANVAKAGYDRPTPIQKWALPIISAGRDLMGCAQTGSGKTAAFLLPVISKILEEGIASSEFSPIQTPQCLVVGPTRELVVQIKEEARKFSYNTSVRCVVVYGGTSVQSQLATISRGCNILVGTPGRLIDFLEKGKVSLEKVKFLILDEADRMLDMGFEPSIRKIVGQFNLPPKTERQTLMFSATFPEEIQKLAWEFLNDYLFVTVGVVGGANTDIRQEVFNVAKNDKREKLVSLLREQVNLERTLIFVEQKRAADFLASFLSQSEFPTTSIHGDRLQREREEALSDFKQGRAPILVATSVAARGLDINDVKHVINYDLPSMIDEYVHRIGRTGRCGNVGKATSFFDSDQDKDLARSLVKILQEAHQVVPDWLDEEAQQQYGGGFHQSGRFANKDTRRGNFGGGGADDGWGASNGGGVGSTQMASAEEEWD